MMEKNDVQSMLCMACLCVGRSPQELTDKRLKQYYMDTLNEIPLGDKPLDTPVVCWECVALLKKLLSFREQVKDSYRILQTYTHENLYECLLSDVSRPPRLKVHINSPVIISPLSDCGRGTVVKEEVKIEWSSDTENAVDQCTRVQNGDKGAVGKHRTLLEVEVKGERNKRRKQPNASNVNSKQRPLHLKPRSDRPTEPGASGTNDHMASSLEKNNCKKEENTELGDLEVDDHISHTPDASDEETEDVKNLLDIKKERTKSVRSKMRNAKKVVKRLRSVKKVAKPSNEVSNRKILILELTYEEMLAEREKDAKRDGYIKAEYKCETCLIGFNYQKSYKAHLVAKHSQDIGDYSCPICKTVIPSVESFTAHYKRHMRRYECSICRKRTVDSKAMQQHFYSTHEITLKEYKCSLCGLVSNSIDTHRYHKDTHKARVQCDECEKTFSHRAGLMNHRHAVHELKNAFPCSVCNKVFRWKTSLKRHLEKHDVKSRATAEGAYCSECDIGFSSVCSLQRHLRNSLKHVTHDQLKFICDHCKRRFADKTKLRDHIEEKHLNRTFQCHICQKTSKNRVGLEQHVRNVHKGRPNNKMCHHCGKGFPTKVQLESHIRTHTGERPFICEYCPTTFSQQSNLYKHHRQVHLNIKSKRYPLCGKRRKPDGSRADGAPAADGRVPPAMHYSGNVSANTFGL